MKLPSGASFIISRLNENGYRADIVGGCVRDALLGREPNDFDITTSALPEEMKRIFSDMRTIETGIKHGTLTVLIDSEPYEVTTYRLDGEYTDNRHPDSVTFTRELSDDLSRRDFTVNAMCYNESDGYTDLFGGKADLEKKLIRAVGDPEKRFSEDALRILRAIRFASTLGFAVEESTAAAVHKLSHLLLNVSAERIFVEWKKLIGGCAAYEILSNFSDIISVVIPELSGMRLPSPDLFGGAGETVRELSLFASAEDFASAMARLRSDNKRKNHGVSVLSNINADISDTTAIHRLLVAVGPDAVRDIILLRKLRGEKTDSQAEILNSLISAGAPYRISDLKIGGNELSEIGIRGRDIGITLARLLSDIADGNLENEAQALVARALSYIERK